MQANSYAMRVGSDDAERAGSLVKLTKGAVNNRLGDSTFKSIMYGRSDRNEKRRLETAGNERRTNWAEKVEVCIMQMGGVPRKVAIARLAAELLAQQAPRACGQLAHCDALHLIGAHVLQTLRLSQLSLLEVALGHLLRLSRPRIYLLPW